MFGEYKYKRCSFIVAIKVSRSARTIEAMNQWNKKSQINKVLNKLVKRESWYCRVITSISISYLFNHAKYEIEATVGKLFDEILNPT
jgi:hypothetical protein